MLSPAPRCDAQHPDLLHLQNANHLLCICKSISTKAHHYHFRREWMDRVCLSVYVYHNHNWEIEETISAKDRARQERTGLYLSSRVQRIIPSEFNLESEGRVPTQP